MTYMLKVTSSRQEVARMLAAVCQSMGYKLQQQEFQELLEQASDPKYDCDPHYFNVKICAMARQKFDQRYPSTMVAVNHQRFWLAIPWRKECMFGASVTWKDDEFKLFMSVEHADFLWQVHFGRVLYKMCGNFQVLTRKVEINGQVLKFGEWFAAILFSLSGDHVGMLATLDEAEDRK